MTTHELAQQILDIAQKALEQERHAAIYISDDPGLDARTGLEAIIKLCQDVTPSQDGFKQYEKKEVTHAKTRKD